MARTEAPTDRRTVMHDNTTDSRRTAHAATASPRRGVRRAARATRRVVLVLAAATVACVMGAGLSPANAAQAHWRLHNLDADGCWDAATMDRDGNGYSEDQYFDITNDNHCGWNVRIYNTGGHDSFAEAMTFDMDENGIPEYLLQDTDQRVGFDYVYYNLDQDSFYESVATLADVRAAAQSTALRQSNIRAQNFDMIARMPGFVSNLAELPTIRPLGLP
jgi:hypothetical protein